MIEAARPSRVSCRGLRQIRFALTRSPAPDGPRHPRSPIHHAFSTTVARAARIAVAAVIAAIVAFTAAEQVNAVGPWWLELLRYLPFPVVLVPALVALAVSFKLGLRWVLASAATVALVLTVTMGLSWHSHARAVGPDDPRFRVMTYNIKAYLAEHRAGGFDELAAEIASHDPDILVMQDANRALSAPVRSAGSAQRLTALPNVFAADQYIVASRFELFGCRERTVGGPGQELVYVRCTVRLPNGALVQVATAHLGSPRSGLNAARREGLDGADEWQENSDHRLAQARALAADLASVDRPLIVAGDLNAIQASPVIRTMSAIGLRDAFATGGRGYGYTYGHGLKLGFSFLRIDHVLASPEIDVLGAVAGGSLASQHRPVIADLVMRGR
jgi:vancomycin resistance protein VanJ